MIDHVTKPIDPDQLFSALMRWISPREGLGAGTVKGAKPSDEKGKDIQIPEINGVDTVSGIKRVGGNRSLYRNLLIKFYEEYPKADTDIANALEQGDRELAQRLAHTVKGVAGNIGANDLQEVAGLLEAAIKKGSDTDFQPKIAAFRERLGQAMDALKDFVASQASAEEEKSVEHAGDAEELRVLLEKLEPHLRSRKPKLCKEVMGEIQVVQWPGEFGIQTSQLAKWVRKYKFKDALKVVEAIKKQLN